MYNNKGILISSLKKELFDDAEVDGGAERLLTWLSDGRNARSLSGFLYPST